MSAPVALAAPAAPTASRWLVSPAYDVAFLSGPALLATAVALMLPEAAALSTLGWLVFVVGIDVAHVWASLYRAWLDPDVRRRWWRRLVSLPIAVLIVASAVQWAAPARFWTAMAYLAVFHFVRQQAGFAMLYRVREGLPTRGPDAALERFAIYALCGAPLLWWHAHLPRPYAWFTADDFVRGLPVAVAHAGAVLAAAIVAAHGVVRLRSGRWSPGRDLWLLATAAAWGLGIVAAGGDAAFTLPNVVAHGVPYLALVHLVARRRWARHGVGPAEPDWFLPSRLPVFLAPLLALAIAEEGLWDALVWHDRPELFGAWSVPAWVGAVAVPVLAVPQLVHYLLDGFVWQVRSNPELRDVLLEERR